MITPTVLIASLYITEPPIAHAEVEVVGNTIQVFAIDATARSQPRSCKWQLDGAPRIDAVFPDGLALTVEIGDEVTITSDDPDEAIARLVAIEDLLAETEQTGKGTSLECWGSLTLTVIHCATANVLFCIGGAALTVCACEDEEDFECP